MTFQRALAENQVPSQVGEVHLRYEPGLLIGERPRGPAALSWPEALGTGAAGVGALAATQLSFGGTSAAALWISGGLVLGAAALATAAAALGQRRRVTQRFVLDFRYQLLRLDGAHWSGRPVTRTLAFDQVEAVSLCPTRSGAALTLTWRQGRRQRKHTLIAHAAPDELQALERIRAALAAAFGLRPHNR